VKKTKKLDESIPSLQNQDMIGIGRFSVFLIVSVNIFFLATGIIASSW